MNTPNPNNPRYPHLKLQLSGQEGNAFSLLGRTSAVLRRGKVPSEEIAEFQEMATSGDYDHLIVTIMRWVTVD